MRAFRYDEHSASDVPKLEQIPVPQPKKDGVIVRIRAAGVSPPFGDGAAE
jgi:NADPH:quinone reductase-like Zn-dependent oxidoreductase